VSIAPIVRKRGRATTTKETFRVMKETGLNFVGNAEADIYNGIVMLWCATASLAMSF
jgi:hypothetical protein